MRYFSPLAVDMEIRFCHPSDFNGFHEYNVEMKTFGGTAEPLATQSLSILLQGLQSLGINASVVIQANRGVGSFDPETNKYDGCLGHVQANESDMILQLFEYPQAGENLTQGTIIYDTILSIGSTYVKGEATSKAQILSSLKSFSLAIWSVCVLTAILISFIFKVQGLIRGRKARGKDYYLAYTLTHLLRIHEMPSKGLTRKMLFITASFFSLVVVHCFLSLIKTDLVVVKDPLLFESYQDIIDRKVKPWFVKGMNYDEFFKKSGAPRERANLWRYVTQSFGQSGVQVKTDQLVFLLSALGVANQEAVIIFEKALMPAIKATGCRMRARDPTKMVDALNMMGDLKALAPLMEMASLPEDQRQFVFNYARTNPKYYTSLPDFLFHESVDVSEHPFLQGLISNYHLDKTLKWAIDFVVRRLIETGITARTLELIQNFDILGDYDVLKMLIGPGKKSRKNLVTDCMSPSVLKDMPGFHALTLANYGSLFAVAGGCLIASCFILLIERTCSAKRAEMKRTKKPAQFQRRRVRRQFPHQPPAIRYPF